MKPKRIEAGGRKSNLSVNSAKKESAEATIQ